MFVVSENGNGGVLGMLDLGVAITASGGGLDADGLRSRSGSLAPGNGSTPAGRSATPFSQLSGTTSNASVGSIDNPTSTLLQVHDSPYHSPAGQVTHHLFTFHPTLSAPASGGYVSVTECTIRNVGSGGRMTAEFRFLGTADCEGSTGGGEMRGFSCEMVEAMDGDEEIGGSGGGDDKSRWVWRLWVCFDIGGKMLVQELNVTGIILGQSKLALEEDLENGKNQGWQTSVDINSTLHPILDSAHFDRIFQSDPDGELINDIKQVFLDELFYPGRFSIRTIESGLDEYVQVNIYDQLDPEGEEDVPEEVNYTYGTLREKVETILGCQLSSGGGNIDGERMIEMGNGNGGDQMEYQKIALIKECQAFWATIQSVDRQAQWPVDVYSLGDRPGMGMMVVCREAVTVPVIQDEITVLHSLQTQEDSQSVIENVVNKASLLRLYPDLATVKRQQEILTITRAAHCLASLIGAERTYNLQDHLVALTTSASAEPLASLAEIVRGLTEDLTIPEDVSSMIEAVSPPTSDLTQSTIGLTRILDALSSPTLTADWTRSGDIDNSTCSFIGLSLSLGALQQVAGAREHYLASLLLLLGYVVDRPMVDTSAFKDVIARAIACYHQLKVLRWVTEESAEMAKASAQKSQKNGGNGLQSSFQSLGINGKGKQKGPADEACYSILHAIYERQAGLMETSNRSVTSVLWGASSIIDQSALLTDKQTVTASQLNAKFASDILALGCDESLLNLIGSYPPTPALEYLRARALMLQNQTDIAISPFDLVAASLCESPCGLLAVMFPLSRTDSLSVLCCSSR